MKNYKRQNKQKVAHKKGRTYERQNMRKEELQKVEHTKGRTYERKNYKRQNIQKVDGKEELQKVERSIYLLKFQFKITLFYRIPNCVLYV